MKDELLKAEGSRLKGKDVIPHNSYFIIVNKRIPYV